MHSGVGIGLGALRATLKSKALFAFLDGLSGRAALPATLFQKLSVLGHNSSIFRQAIATKMRKSSQKLSR